MGKPYPIEIRERVRAEIERGRSQRAAARRYDVSPSFAVKLATRVTRTGSAEPARQGRPPGRGKLAPYLAVLIGWVEATPDITMPHIEERRRYERERIRKREAARCHHFHVRELIKPPSNTQDRPLFGHARDCLIVDAAS